MDTVALVKIMLVVFWVMLGIVLVLYVWRKQAKAATVNQSKEIASNVEKVYEYFIQNPDGVRLADVAAALNIKEDIAVQCLVQLETMGVVGQINRDNQNYFVLNKNSELNSY